MGLLSALHGIDKLDASKDHTHPSAPIDGVSDIPGQSVLRNQYNVGDQTKEWTVPPNYMWVIVAASGKNGNRVAHWATRVICKEGGALAPSSDIVPANATMWADLLSFYKAPLVLQQGDGIQFTDSNFQAGDTEEYLIVYYEVRI